LELGLRGKVALINGATGGIGSEIARALGSEGVDLGLMVRDITAGQALAQGLRRDNPTLRVEVVQADLTLQPEVQQAVDEAVARLSRLDILVNVAGGALRGKLADVPAEEWARYLAVKPMGYVHSCRAALPYLRQSPDGRIVNIAGGHGKEPTAWSVMGGMINASVLSLTKALAEDLGPWGVTVNAINPGHTGTRRWKELVERRARERGIEYVAAERELLERVPLKRVVQPADIAALVVFLASERARSITGTMINVDGGRSRSI